jgi:arylsulfatase A-like enzyme
MKLQLRFLGLALLVSISAIAPGALAETTRPNIVYILADDLGWKDVGFNGSDIKTPNMDRLAKGGVQFAQLYAQPMCTPSRAALMTGRYPHRYGLQTLVIPSAGKYGLPTDEWLLPQALKEAGYKTAIVGKWHLGHADRKYWPRQRGFDYQYGPLLGEIDYFTHGTHGKRDWYLNNKPLAETGYVTSLLGRNAVKLIDNHDPKTPLFLYLAFTAPHSPYQAPQGYLDQYKSIKDASRRAYAAMITAMDDEIGSLVKALEKRGMRDNTLIVFQSDNGGPRSAKFTGEMDMSKSTIPADNGPYRDGKGTLYEGGTRVVGFANWPGHIKPGLVLDEPIHIVDMYPTLAARAGAALDKCKPLDGKDVWAAVSEGKPSPRDEVVYDIEPFRAAYRKGDWKLIWKVTLPSEIELYNLADDPSEKNNLASTHPEKIAELTQLIEAQAKQAVPPLLLTESMGVLKKMLFGSVSTPDEEKEILAQP